ncbi:hypothetical protein LNV09_18290 [Paucibacter sp. B2R-40]|uniref:hypothetical protein n=1 Tax=Paucibacter sp. B2R-40 TaxID=2893554 RepID=UPI0021E3F45B|nr:hypothetical protein [Paucibacter sp. B2R-40]MCV2356096.1 hypothetical protein [Paucibacter sp. B2R-40]
MKASTLSGSRSHDRASNAPNFNPAELERIRHFTLETRFAQASAIFLCICAGQTLILAFKTPLCGAVGGTSPTALAVLVAPTNTGASLGQHTHPLRIHLFTAILTIVLSGCASSPAALQAAQAEREKVANNFELTADGWQSLGINEEQQALYRRLAIEARKPSPSPELAPDSLLNRLIKAVFGTAPGTNRYAEMD